MTRKRAEEIEEKLYIYVAGIECFKGSSPEMAQLRDSFIEFLETVDKHKPMVVIFVNVHAELSVKMRESFKRGYGDRYDMMIVPAHSKVDDGIEHSGPDVRIFYPDKDVLDEKAINEFKEFLKETEKKSGT